TSRPCIDDDDCHVTPGATSVCVFRDRTCSSNGPLEACSTDDDCRAASCKTCSKSPSTTCESDADCNFGTWGSCVDAPGDKLACTCGRRLIKLYHGQNIFEAKISDLLRDPDETDLVDGDAVSNATNALKLGKLAHRLRCCM